MDLIKTINEDEEVPDFSENSDEEEFQPTKHKKIKEKDFEIDFAFASSIQEYNKDTWNDVQKYVTRSGKSKTDDKIREARKNIQNVDDSDDEEDREDTVFDSDRSLSDDEMKKDVIRVKEKKKKKKKRPIQSENDDSDDETAKKDFFEDAPPFDDKASFYEMNLSRPLMKAIGAMSFVHPTPIQAATIPVALMGRDICGCAATGTGKTAAYMLPTLERLIYKPALSSLVTRVVVLVPTRELGVQVYTVTKQLAQFTRIVVALSVGGLDVAVQEAMLRKSPDIVIATPGRLIDHIQNAPSFSIDKIEVLILDEADRILDEYFKEQLAEIIKQCSRTRQTLLFSATMTDGVKELAAVSLDRPVKIFVDSNQDVAFNLRQEFVKISKKFEPYREAALAALVCRTFYSHTLVFVQTKKEAHRIHILLGLLGIKAGELHGNLRQPQRMEALRKFKENEIDILIATDVAARGLDIRNVKTVINFVMPPTIEHYIHRVGRTARAGRAGVSVSMCGEGERKIVKQIIKRARQPVKSRLIPIEILKKYRQKCDNLESEINRILKEERQEKMMEQVENQVNKAENQLKERNAPERLREWFQTKKERFQIKAQQRLAGEKGDGDGENRRNKRRNNRDRDSDDDLIAHPKKKNSEKEGRGNKAETPEDRVQNEMRKVALLQVRIAKAKNRNQKMSAVHDGSNRKGINIKAGQKQQTCFGADLTDVSETNVRNIRYDATKHKRDEQRKKPRQFNKQSQRKGRR